MSSSQLPVPSYQPRFRTAAGNERSGVISSQVPLPIPSWELEASAASVLVTDYPSASSSAAQRSSSIPSGGGPGWLAAKMTTMPSNPAADSSAAPTDPWVR